MLENRGALAFVTSACLLAFKREFSVLFSHDRVCSPHCSCVYSLCHSRRHCVRTGGPPGIQGMHMQTVAHSLGSLVEERQHTPRFVGEPG